MQSATKMGSQWTSLIAQRVKNLPVTQETQEMWVQSTGQEDALEKEMATHSSILAWKTRGQKSLASYSPWGHKESDTAMWLNHPHWLRVGPNSNTWCPCRKKVYTQKGHTEPMAGDNGGNRSDAAINQGKPGLLGADRSCCCCCQVASVVSDPVRPPRWQPTRLLRAWDSPGENSGVSCHFLLQCRKVKSESEVTQSCPTLCHPIDGSPPGPPSLGFSRQEHWSGVPLPSPVHESEKWKWSRSVVSDS